jgi:hypothetical protein
VFLSDKAETAVKTRQVFVALQQTRTHFLQLLLGSDPGRESAAERDRQSQMQINEYNKSGGEQTARRR